MRRRSQASGFLIICALSALAAGQARPLPGADVQQIYQRLLPQIERIPIFDHQLKSLGKQKVTHQDA